MDDRLTIRIPEELRKELELEAKKKNITLSSMVKYILSDWLENK